VNLPIPAEICEREPQLKLYGFYRRLNSGKLEFFSICQPEIAQFNGVWGPQLKDMLDKYLPEEPRTGN
jgi:hypothetical protein